MERADYVIVGAGTAGSVLANRLTEDTANTVLVLEAGGSDRNILIQMPGALVSSQREQFDWGYRSEPELKLGGRSLDLRCGFVLGGSSSTNDMLYDRGAASDYDTWAQMGAHGWSSRDVAPYFARIEASGARGTGGALHLSHAVGDGTLEGVFLRAGREAGYPLRLNRGTPEVWDGNGVRPLARTIFRGARCSAADAYLHPAARRPGLAIEKHAYVTRIRFEGRRAAIVEFMRDGESFSVRAEKEIILAGGAIGTASLLQRSGVGDARRLTWLGLEPVVHLPGVGDKLQAHLDLPVQFAVSDHAGNKLPSSRLGRIATSLQWAFLKTGAGATNNCEAGGFLPLHPDAPEADIYMRFRPCLGEETGADEQDDADGPDRSGFEIGVGPSYPHSRGAVRLRSPDPMEPPKVHLNALSQQRDLDIMREGVTIARRIAAQSAFGALRGIEISPGDHIGQGDALDEVIARTTDGVSEICGTCRMGLDDMSVVDSEGRVHGLEGLRIVGSAIVPRITRGSLAGATYVIAERISDQILGRPCLAPVGDAPQTDRVTA